LYGRIKNVGRKFIFFVKLFKQIRTKCRWGGEKTEKIYGKLFLLKALFTLDILADNIVIKR